MVQSSDSGISLELIIGISFLLGFFLAKFNNIFCSIKLRSNLRKRDKTIENLNQKLVKYQDKEVVSA